MLHVLDNVRDESAHGLAQKSLGAVAAILLSMMLQGCLTLQRLDAVPPQFTELADPPAAVASRYWPVMALAPMLQEAARSDDREREVLSGDKPTDHLPAANYLVLSGGGDNGAFGAGLLVGWSRHGDRPSFKVVTGISAGALIAPFAFLGPQYDAVLHEAITSIRPDDIFHPRNLITTFYKDAYGDTSPLARIIAKHITQDVLRSIAAEYAKGRLLLVGTTDLDAKQPVVWNMGEIAASEDPGALELFRKILLASAAIPGVFPPVMIDVDVAGIHYQEMHTDGGVIAQVFLAPPSLVKTLNDPGGQNFRVRHVYVIRNGRVQTQWKPVRRRTTDVARHALDTLLETQGVNDLYRLEEVAAREGEDFHVAYIDGAFTYPHTQTFAPDYMGRLFDYAYAEAAEGREWHKTLPNQNDELPPHETEKPTLSPRGLLDVASDKSGPQ